MNNIARYLIAAALLATLAACGNKGPLVKASHAESGTPVAVPPATTAPTDATPSEATPPPPADPASVPPPADGGGGHG